jgi:nucleoside 2-deoxyribosyltransferase
MAGKQVACPICGTLAEYENVYNFNLVSYECGSCGRYAIGYEYLTRIDKDIFASYLLFNCNLFSIGEKNIFYYIGSDETFEYLYKEYPNSRIVRNKEVENWYPKNFSERIDYILLGLAKLSDYTGKSVSVIGQKGNSLLFIKRYIGDKSLSKENIDEQNVFIREYLVEQKFAKSEHSQLILLPKGMERVDELQKNQTNSKQAFIAMSFSEEMSKVQNAIEKAIIGAGYIPRVMNKIEHNNQIVPEILYEIKQSKFVVAEFSTNNNGAYYEAGYAYGLGKEVIHVCNTDKFKAEGHFDIKQISAVLWNSDEEITELLLKRIEATIGKGK